MKTIGIIGGVGWAATVPAYEWINREVGKRLGASHSARIILYSVDYEPFKALYHHGWSEIPALLRQELDFVCGLKPDCLLIACNTLHKAYDVIEADVRFSIPIFHAVRLTRDELLEQKTGTALFLGTKFTMQDHYFTAPLKDAGINLALPTEDEMIEIQQRQQRLATGDKASDISAYFQELLRKYEGQGIKSVVLACTELPLAIDESITTMSIINPLLLQCRAAVDFALE